MHHFERSPRQRIAPGKNCLLTGGVGFAIRYIENREERRDSIFPAPSRAYSLGNERNSERATIDRSLSRRPSTNRRPKSSPSRPEGKTRQSNRSRVRRNCGATAATECRAARMARRIERTVRRTEETDASTDRCDRCPAVLHQSTARTHRRTADTLARTARTEGCTGERDADPARTDSSPAQSYSSTGRM